MLRLKALFSDRFTVAAVMDGAACPAESFITDGEAAYETSREGLATLLLRVASHGLAGLSSKHAHLVDEQHKIYEFIKGDLRLFYFKGQGDVLIVCTSGVLKKGQRVDKQAVGVAIRRQEAYFKATRDGAIEWDDTEEK